MLLASPNLGAAIRSLNDVLTSTHPVLRLGVAVVQPGKPWLRVVEAHGATDGPTAHAGGRMPLAGSANGEVARTGVAYVNASLANGRPQYLEERMLGAAGAQAFFCLPARFDGAVLGTVNLALRASPADVAALHVEMQQVADLVGAALHRESLQDEVRRLTEALRRRGEALAEELERFDAATPIGSAPAFRRAIHEVERVAVADAPVLLLGATGTGKEVLARHLHRTSARAEGPFVAVNCAALPEALVESELFGHRRGAFTGADRDRPGLFVKATGGTLLLDEVGELSAAVQAKLLRALETREVTPVGGDEPVSIDARFVAATHRDLLAMVDEGTFRRDLYYRLVTFPIHVPSLDERREDIPALVRAFLASACARMRRPLPELREGVLEAMTRRSYPGNVRELRNLVERMVVLSGAVLTLPDEELPRIGVPEGTTPEGTTWPTLDEVQRRHVVVTLARTNGRFYGKDGAAELLGVPPSTLKSRMAKWGMPIGR